jgi:hypothetical protein
VTTTSNRDSSKIGSLEPRTPGTPQIQARQAEGRASLIGADWLRTRLRLQIVVAVGALAFASSLCAVFLRADPALAVVSEFGSRGEGAGQFSEANGIAVAQASGDVYVVDTGNSRLESFGPEGEFRFAVGWGVADGKSELEVCTSACQAGLPGSAAGQFASPVGVGIDNNSGSASFGDVYVVDNGNHRVEKLDSGGHFLLAFGKEVNAVTKGDVCTSAEATACGPGQQEFEPGALFFASSIGIDTAGNVLIGDYGRVEEFTEGGAFVTQWPVGEEGLVPAVAVNSSNEVYVHGEGASGVRRYSEFGSELAPPIDGEGSPRALTLGPNDEIYIDNGFDEELVPHLLEFSTSGAELRAFDIGRDGGSRGIAYGAAMQGVVYSLGMERVRLVRIPPDGPVVAQEEASGVTSHRANLEAAIDAEGSPSRFHFEYGETTAYGSSTATTPLSEEGGLFSSEHVSVPVGDLKPNTRYHFRAVAEDELGHTTFGEDAEFATLPPAVIDSEFATQITPESAKLSVQLNPLGVLTTYHFDYGVSAAYGESAPIPDASAGTGEHIVDLSVVVEHLQASTTYHYRVVAQNALGVVQGPDQTFTTTRAENPSLLDGRKWEQVSPPNKSGASLEGLSGESGLIQAAEAGSALTYTARAPVGSETEGTRSIVTEQLLASRQAGVWGTRDITTKHERPAGFSPGERAEYRAFSSDLSKALVMPEGATPLSPRATERTPYRREASGEFVPLVTAANVPPGTKFGGDEFRAERFGGGAEPVGASSDVNTVALTAPMPLTSDFTMAEVNSEAPRETLFAWNAGALSLVGWLPKNEERPREEPAAIAGQSTFLGSENRVIRHAISRNGERLIYEARGLNTNPSHLYLRDQGIGRSLQLDSPEAGIAAPGNAQVRFQDAAVDAHVVYFTDEERLTKNASSDPNRRLSDLYRCEVVVEPGLPQCVLQDISVPMNHGEAADVLGQIVGTDETGQKVYFVANGVLAPNAVSGNCSGVPTELARCNLYMYDVASRTVKTIATLSGADVPDWGGQSGDLSTLTARVSPNGRYLAFMSAKSLTGYDNRDATSGTPDEEVFEYDSVAGLLRCVSCNRTGQRPTGVFDSGQYPGLLIDRVHSWSETWLAAAVPGWQLSRFATATYQSRYLSNDGRMFFNSFDNLVPSDVNGQFDVYEFEPHGVGSCARESGCVALVSSGNAAGETAFLDASQTGEDVFFLTKGGLSAADRDNAYDVYDAHVCSSGAPCALQASPAPMSCEDLASCRAEGPPVVLPGVSSAQVGSGNVVARPAAKPLTRSQLLAKALRICRKKRGAHRKVCEARAHKRYGGGHVPARRRRRHK